MSVKYIYIKVDVNDGDYIGELNKISELDLSLILPVINEISNFKPYTVRGATHYNNFPYGDYLDENAEELYGHLDGYKTFLNYLPSTEYGFHTIEEIKILEVENEMNLI